MNLELAFSFWLDRSARIMKYFASTKANGLDLGITIDQWVILAMISQTENISQMELGDKTFKDKASVARISDILEKRGFIKRKRNPDNRRQYMMICTNPGYSKVNELLPYVQKARSIGMQGFSKNELKSLVSMLQRIYSNYENAFTSNSENENLKKPQSKRK